jgi:hypothetical protein
MGGEGEFSFFEHDGAYFRRRNNGVTRSVDDVLHKSGWTPYKGADPLAPALYGDEISDPTGGGGERNEGGEETTMAKADMPRLVLLKRPAPMSPADAATHAASAVDWNVRMGRPPATSPIDIVGRYRDDHGLQWTDEDCQTVARHVEREQLLSGETNEPTEATPEATRAWNARPEQPPILPRLILPKRPAPR